MISWIDFDLFGWPSPPPFIAAGTGGGETLSVELWRCDVNGTRLEDLSDLLVSGGVTLDITRAVPATCTLTIRHPDRVRPYLDFLAPVIVLQRDGGGTPGSRQVGLFAFRVPPGTFTVEDATAVIAGEDVTSLLASSAFSAPYTVAAGTLVTTALTAICTPVGLTRFAWPVSARTVAHAITFAVGKTRLEAVNWLTGHIGWSPAFATRDGRIGSIILRKLSSVHPYRTIKDSDLVKPFTTQPLDTTIANVVVVTRNDPARNVLTSIQRNDDPSSPTSTVALGREIVHFEQVSNRDTQADLDAYASHVLDVKRSYYMTAIAATMPDPAALDPHLVVAFDLSGEMRGFSGRWFPQRVDLGFTPATATTNFTVQRLTDSITGSFV